MNAYSFVDTEKVQTSACASRREDVMSGKEIAKTLRHPVNDATAEETSASLGTRIAYVNGTNDESNRPSARRKP